MPSPLRVAVTVEQSWHRVPGGTATSVIGAVAAASRREALDLVGVAARHDDEPDPAFRVPIPVRHLSLPRPLLYESWHLLRWPPVERATGPVHVIHATTFAVPPASAPLVVTVHDLAFLDQPRWFNRRGLHLFRRGLSLARRRATLVTCPSAATVDACVRAGFAPDRLRLVPWGVETQVATEADVERVRRVYDLPDGPFVLWVGTVEPRKNLPAVLEAGRALRGEAELVLVGPAGWKESAMPAESSDGVRWLGFVPTDDLRALYRAADAFCYPSLLEGFGLPVLEAMAQGTPVVTSARSSTEELVGDGGFAVDPASPADVAEALRSVLQDRDRATALSAAASARASEFSWDRTGALLEDVYREAAS